jgi:hypothetical protein
MILRHHDSTVPKALPRQPTTMRVSLSAGALMIQVRRSLRVRFPIVLAMCLAILLPAFGPLASAQPLCLGDTVWDAEAEACVDAEGTPTTDEIPAEDPIAEPTVEATEAGNADLTAPSEMMTIGFYYIYCDSPQDIRAYAAANPEAWHLCQGTTISQVINGYAALDGSHWGSYTLTPINPAGTPGYGGGLVNVPRGRWTITSDTAGGYGVAPVPVCYTQQITPGQAVTKSENVIPSVDPVTGAFDLPDNPDQSGTVCWVHYVPTDTGATIDIVVYFCPADIENFHFRSNDSRRLACNEPVQDIGFVAKEHYSDPQSVSVTGGDRVASFPAVQNGVTTISGSAISGYEPAVAYCELRKPDGGMLLPYDYVAPRAPNVIVYDILTPTGKLYCDWFLLPEGAGGADPLALVPSDADASPSAGDETVAEVPAGSSTDLSVQFWSCPKLAVADDYVQYLASCGADPEPGEIALTAGGVDVPFTVANGLLVAMLPTTGAVTITGDGEPLGVYCSQVLVEDGETVEQFPEVVQTDGASLTLGLAAGTTDVYCDWFATG